MQIRLSDQFHQRLYLAGLIFCVLGMPLSKPLISIGQMILLGNWLWEGRFAEKARLLLARRVIWVLLGFFLLHLIGMLWTDDVHSGWKDIRIKLPLLLFPILIGTSKPLSRKSFDWLVGLFMAAVLGSTLITFLLAQHILPHNPPIQDLRAASVFVPLIRLSLMAVLCVFWVGRYLFQHIPLKHKLLLSVLALWFIFFLLFMQSLTGLVVLVVGGFILLVVLSFVHPKRKLALILLSVFLVGAFFTYRTIRKQYDLFFGVPQIDATKLDYATPRGNVYSLDLKYPMLENGHYVQIYISMTELREAWNKRSKLDLDTGLNPQGDLVYMTLLRYMASRDLRKDADGMQQLSDAEIRAVEQGVTNANDINMSKIDRRIYQVFWEMYHYDSGGNPSGNSVTMRMDLGKSALEMIRSKPWLGVGTGATEIAYRNHYKMNGTQLDKEWQWMHPHNQFLSVALTFGLPALLLFLFSLIYPAVFANRWRNFMYLSFFLVAILSFFDDDTLETQQGATFYAFFNALLLFAMMPASNKQDAKQVVDEAIAEEKK